MRKLLTALSLCLLLGSIGLPAKANVQIAWGEPFTPSGEENYLLPQGYNGEIKVVTTATKDITEEDGYPDSNRFLFNDLWNGQGIYYDGVAYSDMQIEDNCYVYYFNISSSGSAYGWDPGYDLTFAIRYSAGDVKFTVTQVGGSNTPAKNYITPNDAFIAGPDAKEWILDNSGNTYGDINDFYLLSNSDQNVLNQFSFVREDGYATLEFNAQLNEEGKYAYIPTPSSPRIIDYEYIFTYDGNTDVEFTFVIGEFVKSSEFELGQEFTATSTDKIWKNFGLTLDSDVYIETNSSLNYLEGQNSTAPFTLETTAVKGYNIFLKNVWTPVKNKTTGYYGYNGHLSIDGEDLIFTYTGDSSITITIAEGMYTENGAATYMEEAIITPGELPLNTLDGLVELSWGGTITINNAAESLNYKIGNDIESYTINCAEFMQISNNGIVSTFENGATGDKILFKFGEAFNGNLEIADYHFYLPAGVVINSNGALNPDQNFDISVIEPPVVEEVSITPNTGYEFKPGENVIITIAYSETPKTEEASVTNVAVVSDGDQFEQIITWNNGASIEGNNVVLNLGNQLSAANYTLTVNEGAVKVNRASNKAINNYQFMVMGTLDSPVEQPAQGQAEEIKDITITWTGYTIESVDESDIEVEFNGQAIESDFEVSFSGSTITLSIQEPQTDAGMYTVTIPAEAVVAKDTSNVKYYNANIALVYNISSISMEITPVTGSELATLSNLSIEVEIVTVGDKYDDVASISVEVVNPENNAVVYSGELTGSEETDNLWTVTVPQNDALYMLYKGITYIATFIVSDSVGEKLTEYGVSWIGTGVAPVLPQPTVTPEDGEEVEELTSIALSWEGWTVMSINPDMEASLSINGKESDIEVTSKIEKTEGKDGATLTSLVISLDLSEIEEPKSYEVTVTVPELMVVLANGDFQENNSEIELTYVVIVESADEPGTPSTPGTSGIAGIEADATGMFRVYDLKGQNIMTTADGSELRHLAKGLYIINGKKVVIRN